MITAPIVTSATPPGTGTPSSGGATTSTASITVTVPPNAVPEASSFVVQSVADVAALAAAAPLPTEEGRIVAAVSITARDASNAVITANFAEPVTVAATVPAEDIPAGTNLDDCVLVFWDGDGWIEVPSTATIAADGSVSVTATVEHFTLFAVKLRRDLRPPVIAAVLSPAAPTFGSLGLALAVFHGGSVDALETAARNAGASGIWVQDASGAYRLLVVGGPTFLRVDFEAGFPAGIGSAVAVTLTR